MGALSGSGEVRVTHQGTQSVTPFGCGRSNSMPGSYTKMDEKCTCSSCTKFRDVLSRLIVRKTWKGPQTIEKCFQEAQQWRQKYLQSRGRQKQPQLLFSEEQNCSERK